MKTLDQILSELGTEHREAVLKRYGELVAELLAVDKEPPEAEFDNVEDLLAYLNDNDTPKPS